MCKYFAHGYPCSWMKRFGNYKQVHSEEVKAAHDLICESKNNDQLPNAEDIKFLLSRKGKLNEIHTKVNQRLLNIYPKELTKTEITKVKEEEMKDQLNYAFLKMYYLTDKDAKDQPKEIK